MSSPALTVMGHILPAGGHVKSSSASPPNLADSWLDAGLGCPTCSLVREGYLGADKGATIAL